MNCFNHKESRDKTIFSSLFYRVYFILVERNLYKAISLESYYYLTLANFTCYILEGSQNSLKETNILITFVFVVCVSQREPSYERVSATDSSS